MYSLPLLLGFSPPLIRAPCLSLSHTFSSPTLLTGHSYHRGLHPQVLVTILLLCSRFLDCFFLSFSSFHSCLRLIRSLWRSRSQNTTQISCTGICKLITMRVSMLSQSLMHKQKCCLMFLAHFGVGH